MMETDACTEDRVKTEEWQRPKEQTLFHLFRGVFNLGERCMCMLFL